MIKYPSRTTPDHQMNFKTYLVETICLNMNPKLQPHFWRKGVGGEYWSKKFGREISVGYKRLISVIGEIEDPDQRMALVEAIKHTQTKTFLNKTNVQKIARRLPIEHKSLQKRKHMLSEGTIKTTTDQEQYMKQNAKPTIPTRNRLLDEDETI